MPPRKMSGPMRVAVATMRLTPAERARLDELCKQRKVTLSWAMWKGATMYLEDDRNWSESENDFGGVPTP